MKPKVYTFNVWTQGDEDVGIPAVHFRVKVSDLDLTKLDENDQREYVSGMINGFSRLFADLNGGVTTVFVRSIRS